MQITIVGTTFYDWSFSDSIAGPGGDFPWDASCTFKADTDDSLLQPGVNISVWVYERAGWRGDISIIRYRAVESLDETCRRRLPAGGTGACASSTMQISVTTTVPRSITTWSIAT